MTRKRHWEEVYTTRTSERLGWYTPHLTLSLGWIEALDLDKDAPVIDVGGGASTLVDDLLADGYNALSVLDISEQALQRARDRLEKGANRVEWICADVTDVDLAENRYALWHDRAVFHFLTDAEDRRRYMSCLHKSLRSDGQVIIGTFTPEAPPKCSGLPVERYDEAGLCDQFGPAFELVASDREMHVTPGGVEQMYQYCRFQRIG